MKFIRHAAHRKKRLSASWRRPKGLHNKLRLQKKGHGVPVKEGFRSCAATRGKKKNLDIVVVYSLSDVLSVDPKTQGVVIGSVGIKQKLVLLDAVKKNNLTLLTGDVDSTIKLLNERLKLKRDALSKKRSEKERKRSDLIKESEKKQLDDVVADEASKAESKAETSDSEKSEEDKQKEKVLTKAR